MTTKNINIELNESDYEDLKLISKANHRSIKSTVTMITLDHIQNNKPDKG